MALTQISTQGIKDGTITNADLSSSAAIARTKLANVDLVDDTSPQLGGNLDTNSNLIIFPDSNGTTNRLLFGTNKFQMLYDSGNSRMMIDNITGDFIIRNQASGGDIDIIASDDIRIRPAGGESGINLVKDGAVELYFNNSLRLSTTANGVTLGHNLFLDNATNAGRDVTWDPANDQLQWKDNTKASFGNNSDLQIFHDGSTSLIKSSSHPLAYYSNTRHHFLNGDGSESMAVFVADAQCELYHNGTKRFETRSGGAAVFGHLELGDNDKVMLGDSNDLQIFHNGSHSFLENSTNGLYARSDEILLQSYTGNENYIIATLNGAVELYHNNTHMLSTASDGIQLQGDTKISRTPNGNGAILAVTNAQYAKALFVGGWDGGTNSSGISRIRNSNDNLHIDSGSAGIIYLNAYSSGQIITRHIRPLSDNTFNLGSNGDRWNDIFATNSTIQTSDKTKKNTIVDSDLGLSFINKLKPVSYKFNDGTRTHYGLIAQDVETLLSDISKTTTDFAGFIKTDIPDEYYEEAEPNIPDGKKEGDLKSAAHTEYGLRYTEFISPLIKAMQELANKVQVLETEVAALKAA